MRKPTPITEQLIAAIRKAEKRGLSLYRIAVLSGVDAGNLYRMMAGTNVPRLDTAERIITAIGGTIRIDLD